VTPDLRAVRSCELRDDEQAIEGVTVPDPDHQHIAVRIEREARTEVRNPEPHVGAPKLLAVVPLEERDGGVSSDSDHAAGTHDDLVLDSGVDLPDRRTVAARELQQLSALEGHEVVELASHEDVPVSIDRRRPGEAPPRGRANALPAPELGAVAAGELHRQELAAGIQVEEPSGREDVPD
jgi:hypothetical protein